jgi:hypothetical protein
MERQEIIDQLVQLEKTCSNDYELGGLLRDFIRENFTMFTMYEKSNEENGRN